MAAALKILACIAALLNARLACLLTGLAGPAAQAALPVPVGCSCPACDRFEQEARSVLGMPTMHPESLTRDLGEDDLRLDRLATVLWPDDEWAAIITELRRQEGQP